MDTQVPLSPQSPKDTVSALLIAGAVFGGIAYVARTIMAHLEKIEEIKTGQQSSH